MLILFKFISSLLVKNLIVALFAALFGFIFGTAFSQIISLSIFGYFIDIAFIALPLSFIFAGLIALLGCLLPIKISHNFQLQECFMVDKFSLMNFLKALAFLIKDFYYSFKCFYRSTYLLSFFKYLF